MNKLGRIIVLLHILVLYCFIVGFYNNSGTFSSTTLLKGRAIDEKGYFSLASINLVRHTATENLGKELNSLLQVLSKGHHYCLWTSLQAAEQFLVSIPSDYIHCFSDIVVKFQTTDIIFPFHYFL